MSRWSLTQPTTSSGGLALPAFPWHVWYVGVSERAVPQRLLLFTRHALPVSLRQVIRFVVIRFDVDGSLALLEWSGERWLNLALFIACAFACKVRPTWRARVAGVIVCNDHDVSRAAWFADSDNTVPSRPFGHSPKDRTTDQQPETSGTQRR